MIKKILAATDGSDHADYALKFAIESAAKWDADLVVLSVIPKTIIAMFPGDALSPAYLPDFEDDIKKAYQSVLIEAVNTIAKERPEIEVKARLEIGRPADTIVNVMEEEVVNLIVMGSRGLGGITARAVIQCARVK